MNIFYLISEFLVTFLENLFLYICSFSILDCRHKYKQKIYALLSISFVTIIVIVCNYFQLFSTVTLLYSILANICALKFLFKNKLFSFKELSIIPITILYFTFIITTDLTSVSIISFLTHNIPMNLLQNYSQIRTIHVFFCKSITFIATLYFYKNKIRLSPLSLNYAAFSSIPIFILVQFAIYILLSSASLEMQVGLILLCIIISITLLVTIFFVYKYSQKQSELNELKLISISQKNMENYYLDVTNKYIELSKMQHDMHHHMGTLKQLLLNSSDVRPREYVDRLDSMFHKNIPFCSKCDFLDAILLSKDTYAKKHDINISYSIEPSQQYNNICPIDLCAIVANLIDNAIEALINVPPYIERNIEIDIGIKSNIFLIIVANAVLKNPINKHGDLTSTKSGFNHGLGIQSVKSALNNHNGCLTYRYENNIIIATASMQISV